MSELDTQFEEFFSKLDETEKQEFFKNPEIFLKSFEFEETLQLGGALGASASTGALGAVSNEESWKIDIDFCWWGIKIIFNDALTREIGDTSSDTQTLIAFLTTALSASSVLSPIAAAVAAAVIAKAWLFRKVNKGKGVYMPVPWNMVYMLPTVILASPVVLPN